MLGARSASQAVPAARQMSRHAASVVLRKCGSGTIIAPLAPLPTGPVGQGTREDGQLLEPMDIGAIEARARNREATVRPSALHRAWDSDIMHSFRRSPVTIVAALLTAISILGAVGPPLLA